MNRNQILEYAELSEECYKITDGTFSLPSNWRLFASSPVQGHEETVYAIFVNDKTRHVVLGIRGTEMTCLGDLLTDLELVIMAITGHYRRPLRQGKFENKVLDFMTDNSLSFAARQDIQNLFASLRQFDTTFGEPLEGWMMGQTYMASACFGITSFGSQPLASLSRVTSSIFGGNAAMSMSQLQELSKNLTGELAVSVGGLAAVGVIDDFAKNFTKVVETHFKGYTVKIVGHSLGGLQAQLCAVRVGAQCIGFESPGARKILNLPLYADKQHNILNFLSAPNLVNTLSSQDGRIYRLKLPLCKGDLFEAVLHVLSCVGAVAGKVLAGLAFLVPGPGWIALAAFGALAGHVPGWWRDGEVFFEQHKICNITKYLKRSAQDAQIIEMEKWPVNDFTVITKVAEFCRNFMPLQEDKPGIRTILDEEAMRQAAILRMTNYKERRVVTSFS